MTFRLCVHEAEIKAEIERGHWPQASSPELREHAAGCRRCADLVLLTQAFGGARAASMRQAPMVAPGVLWWRAQLRRRKAAVERIGRPLLGAQIFAFAITVVMVLGFVLSQAKFGLRWLAELPQARAFHLETLWPSAAAGSTPPAWNLTLVIPVVAMLALLGGVVVYLASEKQ